MTDTFRVSDPRALKAVAHPLRVRMLGLLRIEGPATATELARKVGESSGLTSYHLRELAKYGFIEEDPARRDFRERRWRAAHRYTSWDNAEMSGTPEGREAVSAMRHRQLEVLARDSDAFERDQESWSREWIEAAGMSDDVVRLTPRSVIELDAHVEKLLSRLAERDAADPAARLVSVHIAAFPRAGGGE
jgi:DNA-binding transcriptional ArsR family regulator